MKYGAGREGAERGIAADDAGGEGEGRGTGWVDMRRPPHQVDGGAGTVSDAAPIDGLKAEHDVGSAP